MQEKSLKDSFNRSYKLLLLHILKESVISLATKINNRYSMKAIQIWTYAMLLKKNYFIEKSEQNRATYNNNKYITL